MPSGKTHDAVTFFLVAPTFAATWAATESLLSSAIITATFAFGGLMFGPDLDTKSTQYTRWGIFRFLWYPYQAFFAHRSRWSHGLIFGTFLRIVYFMGAMTLASFLVAYFLTTYSGGTLPDLMDFMQSWRQIGEYVRENYGENVFTAAFIGLWLGAASHTLTDMAGSFIKHGRIMEFL
jgi:uncharacterized metal-binding protein